jgi:hypothetical protein
VKLSAYILSLFFLHAFSFAGATTSFDACSQSYRRLVDSYRKPAISVFAKILKSGAKALAGRRLGELDAKLRTEDLRSRNFQTLLAEKIRILEKNFGDVPGIAEYVGFLKRQVELSYEHVEFIGKKPTTEEERVFAKHQVDLRYLDALTQGHEDTKLAWAKKIADDFIFNPEGTIKVGDVDSFLAGEFLYYYRKAHPERKLSPVEIKFADAFGKTVVEMSQSPLELRGPAGILDRKAYDYALSVLSDSPLTRNAAQNLVFPADTGENPASARIRFLAASFEASPHPLNQIIPKVADIRALQSEGFWADKWWKFADRQGKQDEDVRGKLTSQLINGEGFEYDPEGQEGNRVTVALDLSSSSATPRRYTPDFGIGWRRVAHMGVGDTGNQELKRAGVERDVYWNERDTAVKSELGDGEMRIAEQKIPVRSLLSDVKVQAIVNKLRGAKTKKDENQLLDELAEAVRPYGQLERGPSVIRPEGQLLIDRLGVVASVEGIREDDHNLAIPFRWRWDPETAKWIHDDNIVIAADPETNTKERTENVLTKCIRCHAQGNAVSTFNGRCIVTQSSQAFFTPAARKILQTFVRN